MLTVIAAAAIGKSCLAGNKADVESGAVVVVVGEYSLIELRIRVAISTSSCIISSLWYKKRLGVCKIRASLRAILVHGGGGEWKAGFFPIPPPPLDELH